MKIAVLMGGIRFDSQQRIMQGILDKAHEENVNIYVFTCDAWTYSTSSYGKGETEIFSLPDFQTFDGIILHGDTVYDNDVMDDVTDRIRQSGTPCVSINVRYDGMMYVGMENANGIIEIVNHLIQVHHARNLNFISGPMTNADAKGRLDAFRQALSDNGIEFDEERLYYGDYHSESGKEAVEHFINSGLEFPDAIVASNDEMALGAFYELQEKGIAVPEQVLLTGYDYAFAGRNHYPKITSVKRPERELGALAVNRLLQYIQGKGYLQEEELVCEPVFTESCGCPDIISEEARSLRKRYVQEKLHTITFSEIMKSSSADFTGALTFEQLLAKIRRYILMMEIEEFYLCLCAVVPVGTEAMSKLNPEVMLPDMTTYAPEISIPIAYRDGEFTSYGKFSVTEILPQKFLNDRKGSYYIIVPLHYQERCYGYCVMCNNRLMMESELFHMFIMNIDNALESIRKQNLLNSMVERLNRMWVYDTLTGIYNRAGFFQYASDVIQKAKENAQDMVVFFMDMDGLKEINDKYGHEEGDAAIKGMANVLSQLHGEDELLMRYGGDEFVVLARGYSQQDAERYLVRLQVALDNYNAISAHLYRLEASVGYSLMKSDMDFKLERVIEEADQEMYEVKKARKNKRS